MKKLKITMDHQVRELSLKYLEAVGGPVAERIISAIRADDWGTVTGIKINPRLYDDFYEFQRDYLACEVLRKYPGFPSGVDRVAVAKQGFWSAEKSCYIANRRLYPYVDHFGDLDERVLDFISRVRKKVQAIIGEKPPEITDFCDFGPGATYDCRGKHVLPADKIELIPTRTSQLFGDISHLWIYGTSRWGVMHNLRSSVIRGNRFTTVPKDSEKDRCICIEPTLNVYIQKGYGRSIRRRLKKAGIDLDNGQVKNGMLAQEGSRTGEFSTIDLSSASDTVSRSVVELLLPKAWYEALDAARSHSTEIDGKWVRLEKFSSMGNGFTFELETLIFAAICSSLTDADLGEDSLGKTCLVYGDDIIVPTKLAGEVIASLRFFGFSINERKTFVGGKFRESCGTDSFDGQLIKPLRIDSVPDSPEWWMACANGITRAIKELRGPYNPAWKYAISQLPLNLRKLRGPERLGDGVIHDPSWESCSSTGPQISNALQRGGKRLRRNADRFSPGTLWVKALLSVTRPVRWEHWTEEVQLATRLLRIGDNTQGHSGRGCLVDRRIGWVSVS